MDEFLEFRIEANEILDEAEDGVLRLKEATSFEENYNLIFRCFHSLKGAAGMFAFELLEKHMHHLESLFFKFNEKGECLTEKVIDYFLKAIDEARHILKHNKAGSFKALDYEELMEGMRAELPENFDQYVEEKIIPTLPLEDLNSCKVPPLVYLVDDEEDLLFILDNFLSDEGYIIKKFTSPLVLLEALEEEMPDLIISDYKMPELTGLELAKKIFHKSEEVEVIFVSGFLKKEEILEGVEMGIFTFLTKPVDEAQLLNASRNAIGKARTNKLMKKSLDHLLYHFYEYHEILAGKGDKEVVDQLRKDIYNLYLFKLNLLKRRKI